MDPTPPPTRRDDLPQGSAGGGGEWLSPLASGGAAAEEAEAVWGAAPLPEGDPRRANAERCRFGLCVEGGDTRPWDPVHPGEADGFGGPDGLDQDHGAGGGGELWRDRTSTDAQVRELWEMMVDHEMVLD